MVVIFLVFLLANEVQINVGNVISTAQGQIKGVSRDGYQSYIGIPYGSVSGNAGQFKRAGLAPVWTGVRESHDAFCSPSSPVEDCLQLDVHVPNSGTDLPVLAWVTGGSGHYDPTRLVQRGIMVVIVRHRLGPMGFLCSSEEKIPGNAGVKDVVLALRWIRDNIVAFHGNPNNVILGGHSFGAAMVESILLTPMANGLYHGAILQSGTVLAPWAFNYDAEDRAKFLKMKFNGARGTNAFIRYSPADLSAKADELDVSYLPFGICIEKQIKNEERLLSESPYDTLSNGMITSVPLLMGYTNNEAYIFASMLKDANALQRMPRDMNFLLPMELQSSTRDIHQIMKKIKDMYFDNDISLESLLAYHRDAYFLGHIHRSVRFHASTRNNVYYYQFSHTGCVGVEEEPDMIKTGAAHSDELAYLFPDKGRDLDGDDGIVQDHLLRLWTNFVKYLNPTPTNEAFLWEPVNPHDIKLLDIKIELEMIDFPYKKEAQMWADIHDQYYFKRRMQM